MEIKDSNNKNLKINKDDIKVEQLKEDLFAHPDKVKDVVHQEIVLEQVPQEYYIDVKNKDELEEEEEEEIKINIDEKLLSSENEKKLEKEDDDQKDLDKSLSVEYVNYEDDKRFFDEGEEGDEEEKKIKEEAEEAEEAEEDEESEEKEVILKKQQEREKEIKREFDFVSDGKKKW